MSPVDSTKFTVSDKYQSAAIASILNYYEWIYFSILTSYDSYGKSPCVAMVTVDLLLNSHKL